MGSVIRFDQADWYTMGQLRQDVKEMKERDPQKYAYAIAWDEKVLRENFYRREAS